MAFPKHVDGPSCPGCNERLKDGHPTIRDFFLLIKSKRPEVHCSWVFRDKVSQDQDYAQGLSKLKYPQSKHNTMPSRAIDIFQLIDGEAHFDPVFCSEIYDLSKLNGFNLRWGGEFKTIGDSGHFEVR